MKDLDEDAQAPRALFEDAVRRLDADAGKRLRLARRLALEGKIDGARGATATWRPVLAAAVVLALGLAWWLPQRTGDASLVAAPAEAQALLAEDGDDAEIYAWLAEAPVAAEAGDGEQRL